MNKVMISFFSNCPISLGLFMIMMVCLLFSSVLVAICQKKSFRIKKNAIKRILHSDIVPSGHIALDVLLAYFTFINKSSSLFLCEQNPV